MCCKLIGHAFFGLVVGLMMVGLLFQVNLINIGGGGFNGIGWFNISKWFRLV